MSTSGGKLTAQHTKSSSPILTFFRKTRTKSFGLHKNHVVTFLWSPFFLISCFGLILSVLLKHKPDSLVALVLQCKKVIESFHSQFKKINRCSGLIVIPFGNKYFIPFLNYPRKKNARLPYIIWCFLKLLLIRIMSGLCMVLLL